MMEQLAERRMLREEEAADDVGEDSEEEEDEEGDEEEDDEDEDDEDDEEEVCLISFLAHATCVNALPGDDRGAEDGGGQAYVLYLRRTDVRAAGPTSIP